MKTALWWWRVALCRNAIQFCESWSYFTSLSLILHWPTTLLWERELLSNPAHWPSSAFSLRPLTSVCPSARLSHSRCLSLSHSLTHTTQNASVSSPNAVPLESHGAIINDFIFVIIFVIVALVVVVVHEWNLDSSWLVSSVWSFRITPQDHMVLW